MIIDDTQGFDDKPRIYDNVSPCLRSERSGLKTIVCETRCLNSKGGRGGIEGLQPSVQDRVYDTDGISTAITSSYMPNIMEKQKENLTMGKGSFCIGGLQEHQTARTGGISPSLTAAMGMGGGQTPLIPDCQYRIRKLTPLECWRLMGFSDEDFYKAEAVNSNSQLYKQAGNSIVKEVLVAIFREMFMDLKGGSK